MKKILIISALLMLALCGCGDASEKPIDFQSFSSDILGSEAFSEQLTEVDNEIGYGLYGINGSDCTQSMFYLSSGATAEELSLFEATDSEALQRVKDAVNERIRVQSNAFENYVPEELPKLEDSIVFTRGNYIILIVASDYDRANEILIKH